MALFMAAARKQICFLGSVENQKTGSAAGTQLAVFMCFHTLSSTLKQTIEPSGAVKYSLLTTI